MLQPHTNAPLKTVRLRGIHLIDHHLGEGRDINESHAE